MVFACCIISTLPFLSKLFSLLSLLQQLLIVLSLLPHLPSFFNFFFIILIIIVLSSSSHHPHNFLLRAYFFNALCSHFLNLIAFVRRHIDLLILQLLLVLNLHLLLFLIMSQCYFPKYCLTYIHWDN